MKEFIEKYQKAIVGTGAVAVLTLCYFQQKELSRLRLEKTPTNYIHAIEKLEGERDSINQEIFILQSELMRWEAALEIWKGRDSVGGSEFETIYYKETE